MNITPFQIRVPEEALQDLRLRLRWTRWPDSIAPGWEYGASLRFMKKLIDYWANEFDWRAQEERLNLLPHFHAEIDGLNIHFIHCPGSNKNAMPLILTHGWPGSFVEMLDLLPLLRDHFHVVVPSLPGYGFSGAPAEPGWNPRRIAAAWARLMRGLGYGRFLAQGGDWGASVSTWLALDFPELLTGLHLNYIPGSYRPFLGPGDVLSEVESSYLKEAEEWERQEDGYGHIQQTKPQTPAFALNDSPAGLAAWIVEKIYAWSDCNGDVESRFSLDEMLTNVQIYWITQTIHSSMRLYYETMNMPLRLRQEQRIDVPTAVARFPLEAPMAPREWVERGYRVVRWTEMPAGGHFAAWEEPQLLADDLIEFAQSGLLS